MTDWSKPFDASYRIMRVDRSTLLETEQLETAITSGSSITRNIDTEVYESASLKLVGDADLGRDLVRVYIDATQEDGASASVALGTFLPEAPSREVSGELAEWSVNLSGRLAEVATDEFERPFIIPADANIVDEAASILRSCGLPVEADASDAVLGCDWLVATGSQDAPTNKLEVVNKLLSLAGFSTATTDPMGVAQLRRYREPEARASSWSFMECVGARFMSKATIEKDASDIANVVVVVFSTQESETIGVAYDDDPVSPYSIPSLGRRRVKRYEYQASATQSEADAKAEELLRTQQSVIERVQLSHVYTPASCGDAVSLSWPSAGLDAKYTIRTQTLQLGAGCLTKSELRRFERR